jgi:putative membrane protein insertion efficiency factor
MIDAALSIVLRAAIRGYQAAISPLVGPRCRFAPSCSDYAAEAITRHGPVTGTWLALKRLARCHPWGGAGYDPVPLHLCSGPHDRDGGLRASSCAPTTAANLAAPSPPLKV